MKKDKKKSQESVTLMIGRTKAGDPVWRTDNKGRPFLLPDGEEKVVLKWPATWWGYRRVSKPHLSWGQVATANEKGKVLLKALRQGPIYQKNGFLYNRSGRLVMTRKMAGIVLRWMVSCGFVFVNNKLEDGRVEIDLDMEATRKNKVV